MKQLAITLFIALTLGACTTTVEQSTFIGKWQVVNCEADMPSISPGLVAGAVQYALSCSYTFEANGSCTLQSTNPPETAAGSWQFVANTNLLIINFEDETAEEYTVHRTATGNLLWHSDMQELGSMTYELEKQ